jgi:hypothetical protein
MTSKKKGGGKGRKAHYYEHIPMKNIREKYAMLQNTIQNYLNKVRTTAMLTDRGSKLHCRVVLQEKFFMDR